MRLLYVLFFACPVAALTVSDWIQLPIGLASACGLLWWFGISIGKLNTILNQVQPNGGSSMSDRVTRTERVQALQAEQNQIIMEALGVSLSPEKQAELDEALHNIRKNRPPKKPVH